MAFHHGLPPAEQLQAIGMVSVEYQRLEAFINTGIWGLSQIQEKDAASAMTAPLNLRTRLNILRALFRLGRDDENSNKTLEKICNRIEKVAKKRNKVVHAEWLRGDRDTAMMLSVTIRGGELRQSRAATSADWIAAIAKDIAEAAEKLEQFYDKYDVVEIKLETLPRLGADGTCVRPEEPRAPVQRFSGQE
jgi:hypothetical protein